MERVLGSFCGACGLPLLKEVKCCERCKRFPSNYCCNSSCPCHSPNKTEVVVKVCTCASFFTVRGVHKKDCQMYEAPNTGAKLKAGTEAWEEEFGDLMFATCPVDVKDPFYWKWNEHGKEIIFAFIRFLLLSEKNKAREELLSSVSEYIEHSSSCIRSASEAGRPTKGGGYEQKFRGKWYQATPIDETPKCDCGLDLILEAARGGKGVN